MDAGSRKPLEELTPAEIEARAREYELMAATATTAEVRNALLQLARLLKQRAAERDAEAR
jgi:hypothetical protein